MSLTASRLQELDRKLAEIKEGLAADGYQLTLAAGTGDGMRVRIDALDGACEDCLIPKPIFLDYVVSALDGQLTQDQVELFYPGESSEGA